MYILIYMYMCTYTYTYICMCICTWMHICMFVCMMYVCMDAHTHTYSQHPDVCIHLHTWIHTHIQTGNTLTRGGQRRGVLSAVITYIIYICMLTSSAVECGHYIYHLLSSAVITYIIYICMLTSYISSTYIYKGRLGLYPIP